ncbi:MAG: M23 family metallopeptidase [Alphaproteobacteria bacterium]|nr:M23 family metallopeptidase [Alphaproteobacteria bacterium]
MPARRDILTGGLSLAVLAAVGAPARAEAALRGDFVQGTLIRGKTEPGAAVSFDGRKLKLTETGDFVFGVAYDRKEPAALKIALPGGETEEKPLAFALREYKVQRIDGLPDKFVEPPPEVLARIERDNKLIGAARSRDSDEAFFADDFAWPVKGPITGVYGSQRILNGVPKRPHFGVDIAVAEGKPIASPVGAIVAMAEDDLYFTGGTVILDHGRGVSTSYLHMSRIDVKVGDRLAKGDVIGAVGKTGRATGPHLCWRLNWFQERLDAGLVVPKVG